MFWITYNVQNKTDIVLYKNYYLINLYMKKFQIQYFK